MNRSALIVVAVLVCPMGSFGQGIPSTPIELTNKITSLAGVWTYDPTRGVRGSCDLDDQNDRTIRIGVSPQGVNVESERIKGLLPAHGLAELHHRMAGWLLEQHRVQLPASARIPAAEVGDQ